MALIDLLHSPKMVAEEFRTITDEIGPVEANHAMRLLKTVYRYAGGTLDTSLPLDRNPCSGIRKWNCTQSLLPTGASRRYL
jgi:hypothetical protein